MDRIAGTYDLNDQERELVRAKLAELRAQRENSSDPQREEMRRLGSEMRQLWEQRRRGEPVDEQRMQQLREQLREAWSRPSSGWEQAMEQIESVLPPEKVAAGRQRRQEWRDRFAQQREEGRRDRERDDRDRDSRDRGGRDRSGRDRSSRSRDRAVVDTRDDWQRYVDRFCEQYRLDASQRATAQTILRECMERRDKIQQESRDELMKVADIDDARERAERMQELRKPIEAVFQELKDRIEPIPTSVQRLEASPPPTEPTSRPAERRSRRG